MSAGVEALGRSWINGGFFPPFFLEVIQGFFLLVE